MAILERFRAKWIPVRVKKARQKEGKSARSDIIGADALEGTQRQRHIGDGTVRLSHLLLRTTLGTKVKTKVPATGDAGLRP